MGALNSWLVDSSNNKPASIGSEHMEVKQKVGKMGKAKDEGGWNASTILYGLIFFLYICVAVVLFIFMMNRSQRKKKREEREEKEQKTEKEKQLMEAQIQLLQEQQKLLKAEQEASGSKEEPVEDAKAEKMETSFPDPTAEQVKELLEEPKDLESKKTE